MCEYAAEPGIGNLGPTTGLVVLGVRERFTLGQSPLTVADGDSRESMSLLAAIDTGAEISMVRREFAIQLGLKPLGLLEVAHFHGSVDMMTYLAELQCEQCGAARPLRLVDDGGTEHPEDLAFPEMLLGRDVLQYGSLAIDFLNGSWSMTLDHDAWPTSAEHLLSPVPQHGPS